MPRTPDAFLRRAAVEMVDISQSRKLINIIRLVRHLHGQAWGGNIPLFVCPFPTWVQVVGNY